MKEGTEDLGHLHKTPVSLTGAVSPSWATQSSQASGLSPSTHWAGIWLVSWGNEKITKISKTKPSTENFPYILLTYKTKSELRSQVQKALQNLAPNFSLPSFLIHTLGSGHLRRFQPIRMSCRSTNLLCVFLLHCLYPRGCLT